MHNAPPRFLQPQGRVGRKRAFKRESPKGEERGPEGVQEMEIDRCVDRHRYACEDGKKTIPGGKPRGRPPRPSPPHAGATTSRLQPDLRRHLGLAPGGGRGRGGAPGGECSSARNRHRHRRQAEAEGPKAGGGGPRAERAGARRAHLEPGASRRRVSRACGASLARSWGAAGTALGEATASKSSSGGVTSGSRGGGGKWGRGGPRRGAGRSSSATR